MILRGRVSDSATRQPLFPATIVDQTQRQVTYADSAGSYQMTVFAGDTLQFSFIGYQSRRSIIPRGQPVVELNIFLRSRPQGLRGVEVRAREPLLPDSLWKIYTSPAPEPRRNPLVGGSEFGAGGFGLVFHPFTYFSREAHLARRLHKMQASQEREKFAPAAYTPEIVHRVTGLSGDSLRMFLNRYRPTYGFSRDASQLEFWSWIMIQYRSWLADSVGAHTTAP